MTDREYKYWAFLGFSPQDNCGQHPDAPAADRRCWGDWLHAALKTFSIPAEFIGQINGRGEIIPERIDPLFRAKPELPDEAPLSAETRQALEQSRCLIVVCSPRSAQSLQVNEAVLYFKQLGRAKQILPIVIAGEPHASEGSKPGTSPADECFVPALRHPVQPDGTLDLTRRAGRHLFVDARHGADKREILAPDHRDAEADLEMAKIQLIALLLGVGFNGLWWREQKRHFFDLAEAQQQVREAQQQIAEARRQTQEAQRRALEMQNLPRDVAGQIQEAQNQALTAQQQAREAQQQLQDFQNQVRDTQAQLEEARRRALAAESKVLEAQQQERESRNQLEASRTQASAAQNQVQELQTLSQAVPHQMQAAQDQVLAAQRQAQDAHRQIEEIRQQAQASQTKFLEAQSRVQEAAAQARSAQDELAEARQQLRAAQDNLLAAQQQAREAQQQVEAIHNLTRDVQGQIQAAQSKARNARRLAKVLALLAVLGLLAASVATSVAWRQRKVASQALAKAAAEQFDLAPVGPEPIRQVLENLGGAEPARRLAQLAAGIPPAEIPEALKTSAVILNDQQRSHFQKWLLLRLGWVNPVAAMNCAGAIESKIVNADGLADSARYFQFAVLDNWQQTDLPGAFNWVRQLPDEDFRQCALTEFFNQVKSLPDAESKKNALTACLGELAKTNAPSDTVLTEALEAWRQRLVLPAAIMPPPIAGRPWTKFLLNPDLGSLTLDAVATTLLANPANDPAPIPAQE